MKTLQVAAYVEWLGKAEPQGQGLSKPTVKQHLAALRMLFDWLVVGHVLDTKRAGIQTPHTRRQQGARQ